jgi:predicted nucleic acid-binding Zn ribbon protein
MNLLPAHRRAPRPLGTALTALEARLAPATRLARVQAAWPAAAGQAIAAAAQPTAEREGVLTLACAAAVWAAELELMGPELVAALNRALGEEAITAVRCRVA